MHAVPLPSDHLLEDKHFQARELAEDAAICAEICSRLVQWRDLDGPAKPLAFLRKLVRVAATDRTPSGIRVKDHPGLWLVVGLLSGDADVLTRSYREQALELGVSKQAVEQGVARALDRIRAAGFPEVADVIQAYRRPSWNRGKHTAVPTDENGNAIAPGDVVPLKRKRGRPRKEVADPEVSTMLAELAEDLAKPVVAEPIHDEMPDEVEA